MADIIAAGSSAQPDISNDDDLPLLSLFEPTEECVCDFGDIILNADDGFHPAQKLRVSSCILAMSSKVFKALFSKKFAEGQAGAGRSSGAPHEVVVKDLPTPLKHLCQMLHHQAPRDDGDTGLEVSALLDLALVADKYDVVEPLRIQFETLLGRYVPDSEFRCDKDIHKLVAASALLYQPSSFKHFTKDLVMRKSKISTSAIEQRCLDLFPADLVSRLRDQQQEARQMLTTKIMELMPQFNRACSVTERKVLVHEFTQNLADAGLMPPDFKTFSLQSLLRDLDSVDIPIVTLKEAVRKPTSVHYSPYDDDGYPVFRTGMPLSPPLGDGSRSPAFGGSWCSHARHEDIRAPTHRTIRQGIAAVESVCQGICLMCIQPKDDAEWHMCNGGSTNDKNDDADSCCIGGWAWSEVGDWS